VNLLPLLVTALGSMTSDVDQPQARQRVPAVRSRDDAARLLPRMAGVHGLAVIG
jgi:hypothetical protein